MSPRSEEHTSELQSRPHLVCRLLLEKKKSTGRVLLPGHKQVQDQAFDLVDLRGRVELYLQLRPVLHYFCFFFFLNDTATTEIYTLSLHVALPISIRSDRFVPRLVLGTDDDRDLGI